MESIALNNLLNNSNSSTNTNELNDEFNPWQKTQSNFENMNRNQIKTRNNIRSPTQNSMKSLSILKNSINYSNNQKLKHFQSINSEKLKKMKNLANSVSVKNKEKNGKLKTKPKNNLYNYQNYQIADKNINNNINLNNCSDNCCNYFKCQSIKDINSKFLPKLQFNRKNLLELLDHNKGCSLKYEKQKSHLNLNNCTDQIFSSRLSALNSKDTKFKISIPERKIKDQTIMNNETTHGNKYNLLKLTMEKSPLIFLECDNEITKMNSLLKNAIYNAQSKLKEIRSQLS